MIRRVFLKGKEKSGKTMLLIRLMSDWRVLSSGWVFLKLLDVPGDVVPYMAEPCEAAFDPLPMAMFFDCREDYEKAVPRTGEKYLKALSNASEAGRGYFDELLGSELSDPLIAQKEEEFLKSGIPCAGVLACRDHTGDKAVYDRLFQTLSEDRETLIIDPDSADEREITEALRAFVEDSEDRLHHEKFDPLMKLRAQRRKSIT